MDKLNTANWSQGHLAVAQSWTYYDDWSPVERASLDFWLALFFSLAGTASVHLIFLSFYIF